jgi:hypothetical protein
MCYVNIYNFLLKSATTSYNVAKSSLDCMLKLKNRKKFFRSNHFLILCVLSLIFCLYINQQFNSKTKYSNRLNEEKEIELFVNRIRDIIILDQNYLFNITFHLTSNDLPKWLYQYQITHLFNFYWLQNGAYLWHLQRMMNLQLETKRNINQKNSDNFNQINIFDYLNLHPEYGIIIDTAADPIQPLFPPLPQTSLSLQKSCEEYPWLSNWYPCNTKSLIISSCSLKPLITYALYDVTIDINHQSLLKPIHYDEIVYIFDSNQQISNETFFVQHILPRLIRLLALVPKTAVILLPYSNTKVYINQYIDILIEQGLIDDKKRLIEYNSSQVYHTNALYSTSSPRSDIVLLNQILISNKETIRRELILIIRNQLDEGSFNQIIRTLNQFELPEDFEYLHIQEYHEKTYDLKQISHLFRQSRIIIGMPTDILSHIVWCQPHTHIIEIVQKKMTTNFYEISLQLQLNYWLVMTTKTNQIDTVDFRNLMMKVLMDIDA